jgi:Carboxypeptidase regulatory-like domain
MKLLGMVLGLLLALAAVAIEPLPAFAVDSPVSGIVSLGGAPVAGTDVGWFDPTTGVGGQTQTAADGGYSLTVGDGHPFVIYAGIDHAATGRWLPVAADRYSGVFVGASGVDYLYQSLTTFTAASTVDVALSAPGTIIGKTAGLAKQRVQLLTLAGNVVAKQRASSTGRYEFTGLIPGRYRVSAFGSFDTYDPVTSPSLVVVAGESTRWDPKLVRTGTVTGVVRMHGKPVKGVRVSVVASDENGTTTDARGRYSVKNVSPGKATLYFSGQGTKPTGDYSYRSYQKHASVTVKSGATRHLDVAIPRPTLLTGSITPTKGAKNIMVALVDTKGKPAVNHYVPVGSTKSKIPISLPGVKAGTYTLFITDNRKTRYAKKTIRLTYGATTSIGPVVLSHKTVSVSGSITGALPYEVAFENAYGSGDDLTFPGARYRITGLVPGAGVVTFNAGGRAGPKPYFTASKRYPLKLTHTRRLNVTSGGPQLGLFTGTVAVGSLPISTTAHLTGTTRDIPFSNDEAVNEAYVVRGAIQGTAEMDGTTSYTLDAQHSGWPKEFVTGAPFWLDLPAGSIPVTSTRGTTVDIGTVQLVVRR